MRLAFLSLGFLLLGPPAGAEVPRVVASIKPLHSLAASVMAGIGEPELLIDGPASPHGHALKPSEARRLAKADLVLWIGPALEGFLIRPLANLGKATLRLEALRIAGLERHTRREGGIWGEDHDHHPSRAGRYDGMEWDGHVWLDPRNGARIAASLAERLGALDPQNGDRYRVNAERLGEALVRLDEELRGRLSPLAGKPYLVFHDAYQYLERRYGLTPIGAIVLDPERKPSAKTIQALRNRLKSSPAQCIFAEPQFDAALARTVAEGSKARLAILDPLGADLDAGPDHYASLLRRLAGSLASCLE
jgi:zinc transport system substrate-binding protein